MKYSYDDDIQTNLLDNLEALSRKSPAFAGNSDASLGDDDDRWMLLDQTARIDLEVECWGRRLA